MSKCTRCNRPLSDPESRKRGYGPICWAKVQIELARQNEDQDGFLDEYIHSPLDEYIICERIEDARFGWVCKTNVPHVVSHHSPDGYEWGYAGSGPADFSMNIVENLLRMIDHRGPHISVRNGQKVFEMTWKLYQDFKFRFVANVPREGGKIYTNDALAWMKTRMEEISNVEA